MFSLILLVSTVGTGINQVKTQYECHRDYELLGSESYDVRTAAHKRLESRGYDALPSLLRARRDYRDLERTKRAQRLLEALENRWQGDVEALAEGADGVIRKISGKKVVVY